MAIFLNFWTKIWICIYKFLNICTQHTLLLCARSVKPFTDLHKNNILLHKLLNSFDILLFSVFISQMWPLTKEQYWCNRRFHWTICIQNWKEITMLLWSCISRLCHCVSSHQVYSDSCNAMAFHCLCGGNYNSGTQPFWKRPSLWTNN